MSAQDEIRESADILGWSVHPGWDNDTLIRGNRAVMVTYNLNGTINKASSYPDWRDVKDGPAEVAAGKHKKASVLAWLAET